MQFIGASYLSSNLLAPPTGYEAGDLLVYVGDDGAHDNYPTSNGTWTLIALGSGTFDAAGMFKLASGNSTDTLTGIDSSGAAMACYRQVVSPTSTESGGGSSSPVSLGHLSMASPSIVIIGFQFGTGGTGGGSFATGPGFALDSLLEPSGQRPILFAHAFTQSITPEVTFTGGGSNIWGVALVSPAPSTRLTMLI